jgi:glycosyltransferase involved in cell wall biosynthesis
MKVSFIIVACGFSENLQFCIDSIEEAKNCGLNYEIVVVSNTRLASQLKLSRPENCLFLKNINSGLSASRNLGIQGSSGDYLVFLDDDSHIGANFCAELYEILSDKTIPAICGRILVSNTKTPYARVFYTPYSKCLNRLEFRYFMGSSHILKREVFNRVGPYDSFFGAGSTFKGAEESDLFFRMKEKNIEVLYEPRLIFFHPKAIPPKEKVLDYSYAIGAMLTKQCLADWRYSYAYLFLLAEQLIKPFLRLTQNTLFGFSLKDKVNRHYLMVCKGTLLGIRDFIRLRYNFRHSYGK